MKKGNKICIAIIAFCTIAVVAICGVLIATHKEEKISDAMKFKKQYEAYNGLKNDAGKEYLKVNIPEDNKVVYKTGKEIIDVLKNEDAIIYFGFANCPWCRNVIGPLLDAIKEEEIGKLYYVDITGMRDEYKFSGSIIPDKTKEGTPSYYEILDFLGEHLEEYYVKDEKGNMYDTGVTRLYAPTVVAVSNGKVTSFHEGTLDTQKDPYVALEEKDKEKLKGIFKDLIKTIKNVDSCTKDSAC